MLFSERLCLLWRWHNWCRTRLLHS